MFAVGDVVRLKSSKGILLSYSRVGNVSSMSMRSNQKMTVEHVSETGARVDCVWFVGGELKRDGFLAKTLVGC